MNQIVNACTKLRSAVIAVSISIVLAIPAAAQPVQIVFDLSADTESVALQFDVMPHAGTVELSAPRFSGASPHVVDFAVVSSGATRYVVYSTSGGPISPSGTIQANFTSSVPLRDGMIQIVNVMASNADGIEVPAQPTSLPVLISEPRVHRSAEVSTPLTLYAPAVDLDGSISSIQYFAGGSMIGAAETSPFATQFTPLSPGLLPLTARATDNLGSSSFFDLGVLRAFTPAEFTDFASFNEIHFGAGMLSGFLDDPMQIGIPNAVAYLLGINPNEPDPTRLPRFTLERDPAELLYSFQRVSSAVDVLWNVLHSKDLLEWFALPPSTVRENDTGTGYHEVEIRLPLGPTPSAATFLNLTVAQP